MTVVNKFGTRQRKTAQSDEKNVFCVVYTKKSLSFQK